MWNEITSLPPYLLTVYRWLAGSGGCESRRRGRCPGRRPCENTFAGRVPLSEPETVAVANFIMQHRRSIRLYLSLHCYSQLWLTPWGYSPTPPADNDDLVSRQQQQQQQQPFNGRLSGTTRVGRYQKKHSPAHTHPGQRTSFITFLHLQRSTASSLFSLRA